MSESTDYDRSLYFIADAHALTSVRDPKAFKQYVYEIAATWIALGLEGRSEILLRAADMLAVDWRMRVNAATMLNTVAVLTAASRFH